jgi:hypothetical protein
MNRERMQTFRGFCLPVCCRINHINFPEPLKQKAGRDSRPCQLFVNYFTCFFLLQRLSQLQADVSN